MSSLHGLVASLSSAVGSITPESNVRVSRTYLKINVSRAPGFHDDDPKRSSGDVVVITFSNLIPVVCQSCKQQRTISHLIHPSTTTHLYIPHTNNVSGKAIYQERTGVTTEGGSAELVQGQSSYVSTVVGDRPDIINKQTRRRDCGC